MIENQTVFILGAGAHCSYEFPSGEELKSEVISAVKASINAQNDNSFLVMPQYGAAKNEEVQSARCKSFALALENAGHASIDAFLNSNQHQLGFQPIGKGAIAQVLLEYEKKAKLGGKDDWIGYLFKVLLDGVKSADELIEKNKIGFITFNYDRFLEIYLHTKIKYSFGIEDAIALEVLKKIPIIHIYGTLGDFPRIEEGVSTAWVRASKGIRTIFDTEKNDSYIESAKELLSSAHTLCLLGFGYHRENIELLDLVNFAQEVKGIVCSSRFGIEDAEWDRYTKPFNTLNILAAHRSQMCLGALRTLPIF